MNGAGKRQESQTGACRRRKSWSCSVLSTQAGACSCSGQGLRQRQGLDFQALACAWELETQKAASG